MLDRPNPGLPSRSRQNHFGDTFKECGGGHRLYTLRITSSRLKKVIIIYVVILDLLNFPSNMWPKSLAGHTFNVPSTLNRGSLGHLRIPLQANSYGIFLMHQTSLPTFRYYFPPSRCRGLGALNLCGESPLSRAISIDRTSHLVEAILGCTKFSADL
eukprot:13829676-Ditylum_brightwellii.AAC.1